MNRKIFCILTIGILLITVFPTSTRGFKVIGDEKTQTTLIKSAKSIAQNSLNRDITRYDKREPQSSGLGEIDLSIKNVYSHKSPTPLPEDGEYKDYEIIVYEFDIINLGSYCDGPIHILVSIYYIYSGNTDPVLTRQTGFDSDYINEGLYCSYYSMSVLPKDQVPKSIKIVLECDKDVNTNNNCIEHREIDLGVTISGYVKDKKPIGNVWVSCNNDYAGNSGFCWYYTSEDGFYILSPSKNNNGIAYSYLVTSDNDGNIKTFNTPPLDKYDYYSLDINYKSKITSKIILFKIAIFKTMIKNLLNFNILDY